MSIHTVPWTIGTQDVRSSLFPLAISVDGYGFSHRNAAGVALDHFAVVFDGSTVTYLMVDDQWKTASQQYFDRVRANPSELTTVFEQIHATSDAFYQCAQEIAQSVSASLDPHQLLQQYHTAIEHLRQVYHYGLVPMFLDFKEYTYVTDLVLSILRAHGVSPDEEGRLFALLTTPTGAWDFTLAEDEMRQLLQSVRATPSWRDAIANASPTLLDDEPELRQLLEEYRQQFEWLHYGYEGPVMRIDDVLAMVRERLGRVGEDRSVKQSVARQHQQIQQEQAQALQRYAFNAEEIQWFEIARKVAFYKSYRRLRQSQGYARLEPVLRLLAQHSGLSLELWRMLTPQEVEQVFFDLKAVPSDLQDRRQVCVYGRERGEPFLLSGASARAFIETTMAHLPETQTPLLHGHVAYPGVVEGMVVVVRTPEDIAQVQSNAIIVSPSLNPYMQLAMERCRAIVTDAGGLTCHAAVVAREYQIPCIVGVKNASNQIRTGDYVRVDANHGIVTILRHD